jgi:hypothetical protein
MDDSYSELPSILRFKSKQYREPGQDPYDAIGIPEITAMLKSLQINNVGQEFDLSFYVLIKDGNQLSDDAIIGKIGVLEDRRLLFVFEYEGSNNRMMIRHAESFVDILVSHLVEWTDGLTIICLIPNLANVKNIISSRPGCDVETFYARFVGAIDEVRDMNRDMYDKIISTSQSVTYIIAADRVDPPLQPKSISFLNNLPDIFKFKPMSTLPPPANGIAMMSNLPTLTNDSILGILSLAGSRYPELSRNLSGPITKSLTDSSCFGPITEAEFVGSMRAVQLSPIGTKFEFDFVMVNDSETYGGTGYLTTKMTVTSLDGGRLMFNAIEISFVIICPESFMDILARTNSEDYDRPILSFVLSPLYISSIVSTRESCNQIPNYVDKYYNRMIDAAIRMVDVDIDFSISIMYIADALEEHEKVDGEDESQYISRVKENLAKLKR